MSRSYRKPFAYIFGVGRSSKQDKIHAARAYRRFTKQSLQRCLDWEEYSAPHRYEAAHNDVWGWDRDGIARYQQMSDRALTELGLGKEKHYLYMLDWLVQCRRK